MWGHLILQLVGEVAYELALPAELAFVHPVFHVSMLKKFLGDPASILPVGGLGVGEDLSYEEVPVLDLRQTGQVAEEQGDCHNEGIVEKSSC